MGNQPSNHTILSLINHLQGTEFQAQISTVQAYKTTGIYDVVLLGSGDIHRTISEISELEGIISSRTLILREQHKKKSYSGKAVILLADALHGRSEEAIKRLQESPEVYAVYTSVGIYGLVALADSNADVAESLRENSALRTAVLLRTDTEVELPDVVEEEQQISAQHYDTRNKYEFDYHSNPEINRNYGRACFDVARALIELEERTGKPATIYAPLRGAKPMLDLVLEAYRMLKPLNDPFSPKVLFPVTSSFVFYPEVHPYKTKKGKHPASGRFTNVLELQRLVARAEEMPLLVYLDEIVSGGMMTGHVKEMVEHTHHLTGLLRNKVLSGEIDLHVFGIAHANGKKFGRSKRKFLRRMQKQGLIQFQMFPVLDLVTEDQRFLLGLHYLLNNLGPNTIPFVDAARSYYFDRTEFYDDAVAKIKQLGADSSSGN